MVSIYIYLDVQTHAQELMQELMKKKLAAHASVDFDNTIAVFENNQVKTKKQCLITLQTKALLFSEITKLVHHSYGQDTRIYSLPITQANDAFSDFIRNNTLKI